MQNIIKMKNSFFQREFTESSEERIATFFNFANDEQLLCAVWTAPFLRYGFAVSDKALYWHLKTNDGIKSGGIHKNSNAEFLISPYIFSENSASGSANSVSEECSKLEVRSNGKREEFYISGLSEEKGKTLCDILKFAFTQGSVPQTDLGELVKTPRFILIRIFCDEILNAANSVNDQLKSFKENIAKTFHKITHIEFKFKKTEKTEKVKSDFESRNHSEKNSEESRNTDNEEKTFSNDETEEKNMRLVRNRDENPLPFLLNFLDVCASSILILTVIGFLRDDILGPFGVSSEQFSKIGLAVFTVLKCAVAFYSKKPARKIIVVIIVTISILSYFLFSYSLPLGQGRSFIPFIIISVLLLSLSYFAFELLCGLSVEAVFNKIFEICILVLLLYIILCFVKYPDYGKNALIESACTFGKEILNFCKTL